MYHIVDVQVLKEYHLKIRFSDGTQGEVNLSNLVGKGVFAAWKDPKNFAKVSIDPESHTVCWPGGIDLAPDALYEDVKKKQKAA